VVVAADDGHEQQVQVAANELVAESITADKQMNE
jgi:hypothetical protein